MRLSQICSMKTITAQNQTYQVVQIWANELIYLLVLRMTSLEVRKKARKDQTIMDVMIEPLQNKF